MKRRLQVFVRDGTGARLAPGRPERCEGNGRHSDVECCCDECDWYLDCYQDELEPRFPDLYEDNFEAELREALAPLQEELHPPDRWPAIEAKIRARQKTKAAELATKSSPYVVPKGKPGK